MLTSAERKFFHKYISARNELWEDRRIIDFIKLEQNFAREEIDLNAGKKLRQRLKSLLNISSEIMRKLVEIKLNLNFSSNSKPY